MTEYTEIDTRRGDHQIEHDRWGRYLLPDPETGKVRAWTRATTISSTLKDRFALEQWSQRNIAWGIGQRPDLYARASAARREDDDTLSEIIKRAEEAAAAQSGAITGSALHQFAERVDRGEDITIPAPHDADIAAYRKALEAAGIKVAVGWLERVVCVPDLGIVGTLDRIYDVAGRSPSLIGDLKTATDGRRRDGTPYDKVLDYGMVDIPLQLAIYARASLWWDGERWVGMPAVDQERALLAHVPAGLGECRLYEVDISAGWEAVLLAMDVRAWRKRKGLAEIVVPVVPGVSPQGQGSGESGRTSGAPPGPSRSQGQVSTLQSPAKGGKGQSARSVDPPAPGPDPEDAEAAFIARFEWVRGRVEAIKAHPEARRTLASCWSEVPEIPTFPKGGPTGPATLDQIAGFCSLVEMTHSLPFPDEEPGVDYSQRSESMKRGKGK